jgi:hypothetical protein
LLLSARYFDSGYHLPVNFAITVASTRVFFRWSVRLFFLFHVLQADHEHGSEPHPSNKISYNQVSHGSFAAYSLGFNLLDCINFLD